MGRRPQKDAPGAGLLILVDTSIWVEFLRATGSKHHLHLKKLLADEAELALTQTIFMELLAGAKAETVAELRARLLAHGILDQRLADHEDAAAIYRRCRAAGDTPRTLVDCLIAAVAIRMGTPLLHNDSDFDAIARHTRLQIVQV